MKIALLADIHGNSLALAAVLDVAKKEGVDELLILGDLVGYYFHPDKVLELLEPWNKSMIRGNHEESLFKALKSESFLEKYEKRYGKGLNVALDVLSEQQVRMLTELPNKKKITRGSLNILMCHGSAWDTNQYIYPDASDMMLLRCFEDNISMVLSGHTHYPMLKRVNEAVFVNPGSVGQARDRKLGAAWALLETESGEISFRRELYHIETVVEEAQRMCPNMPYLSEVLLRQ